MQADSITVIIKPTNACNLRCSYCYNSYDQYSSHKMTVSIYRHFVELLSKEYARVQIIWHGGEPLLMGIPFYEECFTIQSTLTGSEGTVFSNAIQTNATLVDKDWCDFIKANSIKVGISFDGPPFGLSGRGGSEKALQAITLLKKEKINFGAIAVINSININHIDQIYDFFVSENIPVNLNCVFDAGKVANSNKSLLISEQEYIDAFSRVFMRWFSSDKKGRLKINPFDNISHALSGEPKTCETTGCMYRFLAIDSNGSLYPCGRFSPESISLGHIHDYNRIWDIFDCEAYSDLVKKAIIRRKKCKESCEIYPYCNGGCNADAMFSGDVTSNGYLQCVCYKKLLLYIKQYYAIIKRSVLQVEQGNEIFA